MCKTFCERIRKLGWMGYSQRCCRPWPFPTCFTVNPCSVSPFPFSLFTFNAESILNRLHQCETPKPSCIQCETCFVHFQLPNGTMNSKSILVHFILCTWNSRIVCTNLVHVLNLIQLFRHKSVIIPWIISRNLIPWQKYGQIS